MIVTWKLGGERATGGVLMNSPTGTKAGENGKPNETAAGWFARLTSRGVPAKAEPPPPRLLFLDDDPRRAEIFLTEHPQAVWVETVVACIARLEENWDEVYLDHDLGGQQLVESANADCGMEVIRWLCKEPREHLVSTLFIVHTHNLVAALLMVMQMRCAGFTAEFRPFGQDLAKILAHNEPENGSVEELQTSRRARPRWLNWASFLQWAKAKLPRQKAAN